MFDEDAIFYNVESYVGTSAPIDALTSFLARANAITTLSGTETTAYTDLFNGLAADGVLSLLDVLYIFATASSGVALLNLIQNAYNGTNNGTSLNFTVDQGFMGIGSSVIDTGFNPASAPGAHYSLNSASFGLYDRSNRTPGNATQECGFINYPDSASSAVMFTGDVCGWNINDQEEAGSFATLRNANTTSQGQYAFSRTSSTATLARKNGGAAFAASIALASTALPTNNWAVFGNDPSNGGTTTDQLSAWWCGGGLTTTQMDAIASRINAYMTAVGCNVY